MSILNVEPRFFKVIGIFLLLVLLFFIYQTFKPYFASEEEVDLNKLAYGLEGFTNEEGDETMSLEDHMANIGGYIYFDSLTNTSVDGEESESVTPYYYDISDDYAVTLDKLGNSFGVTPNSADEVYMLSFLASDEEDLTTSAVRLDLDSMNYMDLIEGTNIAPYSVAVSEGEEGVVATAFVVESLLSSGSYASHINLFNTQHQKQVVLEDAHSPVWINEGTDLIYLKEDGVYRYSINFDKSEIIYDKYIGLKEGSRIAVSNNDSYAVLTIPGLSLISVLKLTDPVNGEIEEIGAIQNNEYTYSTPVFSPDGMYYATVASSDYYKFLQIRYVYENDVIVSKDINEFNIDNIKLSAWSDIVLNTN